MQKPAKAHSSANNTIHDAADRGSGQPQISQPLRPSSSFSTDQHSPPTLAQHHAHTQQQATQQARVQSTQHALPQHGPATSHRYKEAPQVANKKDHKKGLSVVYYPVKRRPGRGQLRPREHSQHQKQDQQQGAIREKHSQHQKQEQRQGAIREKHGQDQKQDLQQGASRPNNREKTRVEQQHKQGRDHHHRQQQQQQQQHLQGKQREQDSHHRKHKRRMRKEQQQREQQQQEQQQQQQQQHPLPTDLSALPGLCESPGHSSLSSPTAAQLNRFAAHDPPIPGPKEAHSLQDLLDQKGPMDPAYEPPQDEDIPQIRFSPAPPWLVQPIAHTPPRYRG
ncbi:hypothetical protein DUNSADRAFT_6328 [Dunaliella salina]|uniref:Uncharacterized protein n=1 Tax=Dunaliella salina TaxID=3046 RepID=A0ABQ7FTV5_DUNSA|nr:hypothetical protein DUNSADRAFT_6328 [Dunaliella salina]|eukprot:KAF5825859.1 hypothetical protein DUNSADRAFT_6328 [Dunaliella salina]